MGWAVGWFFATKASGTEEIIVLSCGLGVVSIGGSMEVGWRCGGEWAVGDVWARITLWVIEGFPRSN